jgi:uracil-DNA glycosylase family 4
MSAARRARPPRDGGPRGDTLERIARDVIACARCPRLREHCTAVARTKRRAFAADEYWGRPVPGFGDPAARIWLLGLAPAAHGGNRTGRIFTGDRSGDFLYAGLHRVGLASQPTSVARGDGLTLRDAYVSAAGRCAPPANRPLPEELARCSEYLLRESVALRALRVIVCLGGIAWEAALRLLASRGTAVARPRPPFAHGAELRVADGDLAGRTLLGCYHVSQQNTFTGRLTPAMLDAVLARAKELARSQHPDPER